MFVIGRVNNIWLRFDVCLVVEWLLLELGHFQMMIIAMKMLVSELYGGLHKVDIELRQRESSVKGDNDGSIKAGQDRIMSKIDKEGSIKSGRGTLRKLKSSNQSKGPVPKLFWLSEKPICSFKGHTEDILDLSWSRSQVLVFHFHFYFVTYFCKRQLVYLLTCRHEFIDMRCSSLLL